MKEHRIDIEIDAEGRITADADGFAGDACLADLERLLADIASPWETVNRKPDPGQTRAAAQTRIKVGKDS
jgi:hypothetical protein